MGLGQLSAGVWRGVLRLKHAAEVHNVASFEESEKRAFLLALAQRHGLDRFVETGTYRGETVEFMADHMRSCVTIELDPQLYADARDRLHHLANVEVLHGDSAALLPQVAAGIETPALFWLDAHYSRGVTAGAGRNSPIEQELAVLLLHPVEGHVIVLDDARHFIGTEGYPSVRRLQRMVARHGRYSMRMRNDLIWLYREGI